MTGAMAPGDNAGIMLAAERFARRPLGSLPAAERMDVYDRLPAPLRAWLQCTVENWCPVQALRFFHFPRSEAGNLFALVEAIEAKELEVFADRWPVAFGRYPARAAEATVVRPYTAMQLAAEPFDDEAA